MADSETNWIDFYISLTPVAQTGIWAGVAVGALLVLRTPLRQLAQELVQRVNQGDKISTPWLSLERRQERDRKVVEQVTENIRREIHTPEVQREGSLARFDDAAIDALLDEVSNRFIDLIFPASDFQTQTRKDTKTSLYVTDWGTVSDFLNDTYLTATDSGVEIPVWTYGRFWQLKNERTGQYIKKSRTGDKDDSRPFNDLDVLPGDVLIAERIR